MGAALETEENARIGTPLKHNRIQLTGIFLSHKKGWGGVGVEHNEISLPMQFFHDAMNECVFSVFNEILYYLFPSLICCVRL